MVGTANRQLRSFFMAMEHWVFSDTRLTSMAQWQEAIDREKYPLQLSTEVVFQDLRGFLPAQLRGQRTGFECYHDDAQRLIAELSDTDLGRAWKYALGFRYNRMDELLAA